jgi:uncharacterized repeat protein (TIGR02543 family)
MNKTVFFGILVFALVFGLIGCDNGNGNGNGNYTVTFNLDGGKIGESTANVTRTVKSGEIISDLPNPEKDNNTFEGWFSAINGGGTQFLSSTAVTSDRTVFAKWTPIEDNIKKLIIKNIGISGNITVILSEEWGPTANMPAGGTAENIISGNDVTITLKTVDAGAVSSSNWEGNGEFVIYIFTTLTLGSEPTPDYGAPSHPNKINFSNQITEVEWSQFNPILN